MYFISVPITIMRILLSVKFAMKSSVRTLGHPRYENVLFFGLKNISMRVYTRAQIIFERWPVVLTGQTNFSAVMSHF